MTTHKFTGADLSDIQHALKYMDDIRNRVESDEAALKQIDEARYPLLDLEYEIKKGMR